MIFWFRSCDSDFKHYINHATKCMDYWSIGFAILCKLWNYIKKGDVVQLPFIKEIDDWRQSLTMHVGVVASKRERCVITGLWFIYIVCIYITENTKVQKEQIFRNKQNLMSRDEVSYIFVNLQIRFLFFFNLTCFETYKKHIINTKL